MVGATYVLMVTRGAWHRKGMPLLLLVGAWQAGSGRVVVLVVATVPTVSRRWQ